MLGPRNRYPRAPMAADDAFEMESCRACRGTGRVISNLGGTPNEVDCPWCEGTGKFMAEHDAQAKWASREEAAGEGGTARPGDGAGNGAPVDG